MSAPSYEYQHWLPPELKLQIVLNRIAWSHTIAEELIPAIAGLGGQQYTAQALVHAVLQCIEETEVTIGELDIKLLLSLLCGGNPQFLNDAVDILEALPLQSES